MSTVPARVFSDRDPSHLVCARQGQASMDRLLVALLTARRNMQAELATRPVDARRQSIARDGLLESLVAYTSGLAARGLSAPPLLRDELALQRNLASRRTSQEG